MLVHDVKIRVINCYIKICMIIVGYLSLVRSDLTQTHGLEFCSRVQHGLWQT